MTTTVEIKSGYGLDRPTEIKMLEVARKIGADSAVDVRTTYLGAHALPKEFGGKDGTNLAMAIIREHLAVQFHAKQRADLGDLCALHVVHRRALLWAHRRAATPHPPRRVTRSPVPYP